MTRLIFAATACIAICAHCFSTLAASYEIVEDKPINNGSVRDVAVRIPEPITEQEVRRIAAEVKAKSQKQYPKTSIFFLLPGQEPKKGAWARALYGPALKVSIFGATVDEKKMIDAAPPVDGKVIGEWFHDLPGSSRKIAFLLRDGKVFMKKTFKDGSSGEDEIVRTGARKFARMDEKGGEWMQVNGAGDLEFHTRNGKADTAARTASAPPLAALDEDPPGQ